MPTGTAFIRSGWWIKPRLPAGYRAYIGTTRTFAIGASTEERPDVGVRDWQNGIEGDPPAAYAGEPAEEPDLEIAVATLSAVKTLFVEHQGRMIAAVELVSPRNKDRLSACSTYTGVYFGYLLEGVHLLLVDVHRRPLRFSFADRIAEELRLEQPACPSPYAIGYRVGEPAPNGGRFLAFWRRPLQVGSPLPLLPLPLSVHQSVPVDLEQTYGRAAEAAHLS